MDERSPNGSALRRFWRGWRREIIRGTLLFAVVVAAGLTVMHFVRSFAAGWSDFTLGDFAGGGPREWHEAFLFSDKLAAGQTVWIRNRSGAVVVEAAPGESLRVTAEKSWRRSSPEMVEIVTVPSARGLTICALWDAAVAECRPEGEYRISNPRRSDVMVRFTVQVPRGVALDASTVSGVLEISRVEGAVAAGTVNGKVRAEVVAAPFKAQTVNGTIEAAIALRPGAGPGDIALETVNGSITAELAPGLGAELEARTVNGRVESDFPVVVSGQLTSRRLVGRVGPGGRKLALSTVNGSIKLLELGRTPMHPEHGGPHSPGPPAPPAPPSRPRVSN